MPIKLSDYVIEYLSKRVSDIFFLPGGFNMHLIDSLKVHKSVRGIPFLHEHAAAIAADGYAQYKKSTGVVIVTAGPGSTNVITAVTAAWIDSVPLVVISGQTKTSDMNGGLGLRQRGVQEVDIHSIVWGITKYATTVINPRTIRRQLDAAFCMAEIRRQGPVWLEIPVDVQNAMVDESELDIKEDLDWYSDWYSAVGAESNEFPGSNLIKAISNSKRMVILAGYGVKASKAENDLLELARLLNVPILTTWRAMEIISDSDPLFFGRPGAIATRYANRIVQKSDLLLTIGARLDFPQVGFNHKDFAPDAFKIMVDIDKSELNKPGISMSTIRSDAGVFIRSLLRSVNTRPDFSKRVSEANRDWLSICTLYKDHYDIRNEESQVDNHPNIPSTGISGISGLPRINTYNFIDALSRVLDENSIIVTGSSGSCAEITAQAFRVKRGQRFINSPGLGSMGFGLAHAIGVAIASNRMVVCIEGDGSLQMNIQELETLYRLDLPIKLFVLNNNGYATMRNTQNRFFSGRVFGCDSASGLSFPDLSRIAYAYQLRYTHLRGGGPMEPVISQILADRRPTICEVFVNPDLLTVPRLQAYIGKDGKMASPPFDDLWPPLRSLDE